MKLTSEEDGCVSPELATDPVAESAPEKLAEAYRNKTVLVTGGAGFIGSNLVRRLLELKTDSIVVLDDLSSASKWNLPQDNRVKFVEGSLLENEKLATAFQHRPQLVFHLAAHFPNQNSINHPDKNLTVNRQGTLNMLKLSQNIKD